MSPTVVSLLGAVVFAAICLITLRQRRAWQLRAVDFQREHASNRWLKYLTVPDASGRWYQYYLLGIAAFSALLSLVMCVAFLAHLIGKH